MRLVTKHFAFISGRQWSDYRCFWWKRQVRIGVRAHERDGESPYRFTLSLDLQLLPDFIWCQYVLHQRAWPEFQTVIVGVYGWPLYFSVRDWERRPLCDADEGAIL